MKASPLAAALLLAAAFAPFATASHLPCGDVPPELADACNTVPEVPPVPEDPELPPVPPELPPLPVEPEVPEVPPVPEVPEVPPVPSVPSVPTIPFDPEVPPVERVVEDVLERDGSLLGGMLPGAPCPYLPSPHAGAATLVLMTVNGTAPEAASVLGPFLPRGGTTETCEEHRQALREQVFSLPLP